MGVVVVVELLCLLVYNKSATNHNKSATNLGVFEIHGTSKVSCTVCKWFGFCLNKHAALPAVYCCYYYFESYLSDL